MKTLPLYTNSHLYENDNYSTKHVNVIRMSDNNKIMQLK